jgi:tRNA modification GTPase
MSLPITLYTFIAPHSYTGEDLAEFHLPGNPLLARLLLDELLARGARAAEAGEFTARAYFNGRINLAEAEGVAATIAAQNDAELRAARQLLAGELARRLAPAMDLVAQTLALIEVGIDFSEEDVSFLSTEEIAGRVAQADGLLADVLDQSARFERLSHEPRIVLVGRPNAGKSTLLNALAGRERAVVSPVAGTTRDVLWAEVALERGIVQIVDVAGLEEARAGDAIGAQMREHALREMRTADAVVWVQEATGGGEDSKFEARSSNQFRVSNFEFLSNFVLRNSSSATPVGISGEPASAEADPAGREWGPVDLVVFSKLDLADETTLPPGALAVSAQTGRNMDAFRRRLDELAFGSPAAAPTLALNARHVQAIDEARRALVRAAAGAGGAAELLALELREALDALGQVLGNVSPDELLGRIFSAFCIGK